MRVRDEPNFTKTSRGVALAFCIPNNQSLPRRHPDRTRFLFALYLLPYIIYLPELLRVCVPTECYKSLLNP